MCILCVVQKWSRRVATMLPWLLFPMLGFWVFSHLLPPGFRFEFTSPRIACVLVLLVTIFWYEVLMPQLSAWRARNSAKYREAKRKEALERQKLRKTAARLCRNCLTPYKDQNPGGGKFMCSYCGHVSKRPVLDLPSGDDGDGKGGRKECLWFGCIFGSDVSQSGSSTRGRSNFRGRSPSDSSSSDAQCFTFTTRLYVSASKALNLMVVKFRGFWRNVFGLSVEDDTSSDGDSETKEGENGIGFQESKGEKARRKAEEKRQARLERELLEEEERKQREEVAKLVEEQRRLRDEKMDAEKEAVKSATLDREKYTKRDAERKRQDRRKEKDKGSSKSSSDYEDSEGKAGKDNEKKREFDKKSENGRGDLHKSTNLGVKARNTETGNASKVSTANNPTKGSSTRYLDRMKGSFMSSSKAFNGGIFGKGAPVSANISSKAGNHVDHIQPASSRREIHSTELVRKKLNANGEDKISKTGSYHPVASEIQPQTTPKKSWRQLFTRSPAVAPFPTESFTSEPHQKFQSISHNSFVPDQSSPSHPLADQISFGLPLPFSLSPFPNCSTGSSPISSSVTEPVYPQLGDPFHDLMAEELDVFEDPCYDPEAVSLLGPVSEALNFSLDLGGGSVKDTRCERPHGLNNLSPSVEVSKPSPIEAPVSRLRFVEERHANYSSHPSTPKSQNVNTSTLNQSTNEDADGTWKMWGTAPLGHDGLGLIGGSGSWILPLGVNTSGQEQALHPSAHNSSTLQFPKENQIRSGTSSPQRLHLGNYQNGGMFRPPTPGSNDNDPWLQRSFFQPSPGKGQNQFPPLIPWEDMSQKKVTFNGSSNASSSHSSELSPGNRWSKKDNVVKGAGEGIGNSAVARPHVGGLFSSPDVHSLWSYN